MFDLFSWQHIILLLVVALVVVGPKDLPRLMNMMGRWAGKARGMANEFRKSFDEMARQAELDELRREIDNLKKNNPISSIGDAMNEMQTELERPVEMPEGAAGPAAEAAPESLTDIDTPPAADASASESSVTSSSARVTAPSTASSG